MMTKPALSIITPTYNRRHTLPLLWKNLKSQTLANFEWIVIDDGSTDGTGDWIKSLGDKRIVYHWQKNRFMGHARNRGMERMRADYVIFMDSDDEFASNESLAIMHKAIDNAPPEVGRVVFPPTRDQHRYPVNKVMVLDYADYACRHRTLVLIYLSITRSAIAKRFPWQENRAFSEVRDYDIARHHKYMFVNKAVYKYQHDLNNADDNARGIAGAFQQMPGLIDNTALLIARHKAGFLAHCPLVYADRCYEVALFISIAGTFRQHLRLPRLIGAILVYGNWRMRAKALMLVMTLLLPVRLRKKLYALRWRITHRVKAKRE